MVTLPGDQTTATMAVFMRGDTAMLYGSSPDDFNFVVFNTGVGALKYTAQNLFDTMFLDHLGVVSFRATLNFGNFAASTLTKNILPFITRERNKTTASLVNRERAQYRLFFSDGYGLYLTIINQQYLGAIPVLFPNPVFVSDNVDAVDNSATSYFGSSDGQGYVYQLDRGTSFDGEDIYAYIVTAWDFEKSPRVLKRFRAASIEVQGDGYAEISYGYSLAYSNPQTEQPQAIGVALPRQNLIGMPPPGIGSCGMGSI